MDEAEAIQRAIEGDEAAQRVLYEAHRAALYRLAYLLLDNTQDAEEVVQDTFVYALSRLVHYDPARRSLGGWLRMILVSRCRNCWRRRPREAVSLEELEDAGYAPAGQLSEEPARRLEALDARRAMWHALRQVSRGAREALILRYYSDLPYAEIGAVLGCSAEAARARVAHGKAQLRRLLTGASEGAAAWRLLSEDIEG
ncbi:MAG: RNA polymerase sigma factor [Anaerolineales bacterium]|nr:RNA polymerase sigma factor [Anaerolineales bacterium]